MNSITPFIPIALALYEALSRFLPTSKDWTIVGNALSVLKVVSDTLNNLNLKSGSPERRLYFW
jgi:hypothetical protein